MEKTKILKTIELLNENKTAEALELLKIELIKSEDKKSAKLCEVVKKYLNKTDKARPILKTIMQQDGAQFICNGISLYYFNEYRPELEALPQAQGESINAKYILNTSGSAASINAEDLKILKNIKKIVNYFKTLDGIDKREPFPVPFAGKVYDAKLLQECCEIFNFNFEDIQIIKTDNQRASTQLKDGKITAVLMPMIIRSEEFKQKTDTNIKKFFELLEG